MSAIQSSVGLITGINIQETVDQLMAIAARPRALVEAETASLQQEQFAVGQLSATLLALRLSTNSLKADTFSARTVSSSDPSLLTATVQSGATPSKGSFAFTPLQTASAHQVISDAILDPDNAFGSGELTLRFGGHIDQGAQLADLNGGAGFDAGSIKITDRSGASSVIDLRGAQTVDDVLAAINSASDIDVTASVDGDTFILSDQTGESGNFRVSEVSGGSTAASLGLAGLSAASDTLTGSDVYYLADNSRLTSLDGGLGVRITDDTDSPYDLVFTLTDSTVGSVDLSNVSTLGGVVDAINNNADLTGKLTAAITDGNKLTLTDTSGGAGSLSVLGSAAEGLGLTTIPAGGVLTGERLIAGLKDSLVTNLGGGQGITLGEIDVTDRNGASDTIDLSSAETFDDIVDLINASSADLSASVNTSRNGLLITDTSGGNGSLVIANGTSGTTADDLGITVNSTTTSINGGTLSRQVLGETTLLANLNGGAGVDVGDIKITDSDGNTVAVDLNETGNVAETLGDVIDKINSAATTASAGITASLNTTGDGILLTDTASGTGTLSVAEVGNGTTAADLNLVGDSTSTNGSSQQIIDGATTFSVDLSDLESSAEAIGLSTLGDDGIDLGIFSITTQSEETFTVDLGSDGGASTIGDVIDRINAAATTVGVDVTATVNDDNTGILLTDNTTGEEELTVTDLGTGTAAADLNLIRTDADTDGSKIDGAGLFSSSLAERGALDTLADRINTLGAGVTASVFEDPSGFRLSITADEPGAASELLIGTPEGALQFTEVSRPNDAAVAIGVASDGSGGVTVFSENGTFGGVVSGVDVTIQQASSSPVTIDVDEDANATLDAVDAFVKAYNSTRTTLDSLTTFNAETFETGLLFGTTAALRSDSDLARLASGSFAVSGSFTSLEAIGVSLNDDGTLSLDRAALSDAFSANAADLEDLFLNTTHGVVAKFSATIDQLVGEENSLLDRRTEALSDTIDTNNERITFMNGRLDTQREALLLEFFRLEETVALLQSNLDTLASIQPITLTTRSSSS